MSSHRPDLPEEHEQFLRSLWHMWLGTAQGHEHPADTAHQMLRQYRPQNLPGVSVGSTDIATCCTSIMRMTITDPIGCGISRAFINFAKGVSLLTITRSQVLSGKAAISGGCGLFELRESSCCIIKRYVVKTLQLGKVRSAGFFSARRLPRNSSFASCRPCTYQSVCGSPPS